MPWILLMLVLVGAAAAFAAYHRRVRAQMEQLTRSHRESLARVTDESDARLTRLTREAKAQRKRLENELVRDLLPALDALRAAVQSAEGEASDFVSGVEMVLARLESTLAEHDVELVHPAPGDPFNPEHHEAIEVVAATTRDAHDSVAVCHRVGYRSGAEVLRAALVSVARFSEDEAVEESKEAPADEDQNS